MQFVITPGDVITALLVLFVLAGYFFIWLSQSLNKKNKLSKPDEAPKWPLSPKDPPGA